MPKNRTKIQHLLDQLSETSAISDEGLITTTQKVKHSSMTNFSVNTQNVNNSSS